MLCETTIEIVDRSSQEDSHLLNFEKLQLVNPTQARLFWLFMTIWRGAGFFSPSGKQCYC